MNTLLDSLKKTFDNCYSIAQKKNNDYAEESDPFRNFKSSELVRVPVDRAILVRMMDKIARISNGLDGDYKVKDETIFDTLDDLINYSAILKAYIQLKGDGDGKRTKVQ